MSPRPEKVVSDAEEEEATQPLPLFVALFDYNGRNELAGSMMTVCASLGHCAVVCLKNDYVDQSFTGDVDAAGKG